MQKAKLYDISLFVTALAIALGSAALLVDNLTFLKALFIYWLFSSLYYSLRVFYKNGSTNIEYGISYDLSLVLFAGPLGLFIFETIYRFTIYFYRKLTKTADPSEFTDTFYNIGSFVMTNSLAFYLFRLLYDNFQSIPFGFWILVFLLACITSYLSGTFMVIVFLIIGELKSSKEAFDFIFKRVSFLDFGKVAISNGLLYLFLKDGKWELLIIVFLLNYVVSRSFYEKSQNIQTKLERDKFEQMAYTDFLTGVHNRTFMDKKMAELSESGEKMGIVVTDIDKFKGINDTYNHAVGDRVIQHFAATLKSFLDEDDYLFRSGGEEFTLCLRNRNFEETVALVHKIQSAIESSSVNTEYNGESISIHYTASFGLYYYKVNEYISMEKAYILADELMFDSKQLGKNRVSYINGLTNKEEVLA
ncbi:GGDEF domain-containing protein [Neobacillus niacini]|uniref:GGDEF domain-containing protein n=1 Tax=Neobacillus niacini TaxID=86668 RepID=UPI0021CB42CF|nr:GGDEF domain-containing protein [Neobacillus niacini]MCM3766772.1 GGDEF domain-containing protein [Neobacillus niacini]